MLIQKTKKSLGGIDRDAKNSVSRLCNSALFDYFCEGVHRTRCMRDIQGAENASLFGFSSSEFLVASPFANSPSDSKSEANARMVFEDRRLSRTQGRKKCGILFMPLTADWGTKDFRNWALAVSTMPFSAQGSMEELGINGLVQMRILQREK